MDYVKVQKFSKIYEPQAGFCWCLYT